MNWKVSKKMVLFFKHLIKSHATNKVVKVERSPMGIEAVLTHADKSQFTITSEAKLLKGAVKSARIVSAKYEHEYKDITSLYQNKELGAAEKWLRILTDAEVICCLDRQSDEDRGLYKLAIVTEDGIFLYYKCPATDREEITRVYSAEMIQIQDRYEYYAGSKKYNKKCYATYLNDGSLYVK